jgi:hypothetical protein
LSGKPDVTETRWLLVRDGQPGGELICPDGRQFRVGDTLEPPPPPGRVYSAEVVIAVEEVPAGYDGKLICQRGLPPFESLVAEVASVFASLERDWRAGRVRQAEYLRRREAIENWLRERGTILVAERAEERVREILGGELT